MSRKKNRLKEAKKEKAKPKGHYVTARFINKNTEQIEKHLFGSANQLKTFMASFCQPNGEYVYINRYNSQKDVES